MSARYIVGDVFDVLKSLEPASVDLVMTSPPFLALRSYLPADHPDKPLEIGSESTPGEYIDTLLDVVEACARVLAPHGSMCFELGDTYSGSGGAGGDYGWDRLGQRAFQDDQPPTYRRKGQVFAGSKRQSRERRSEPAQWTHSNAAWLAAMIDAEGAIVVGVDNRKATPHFSPFVTISMNSQSVVERAARITGVGHVIQKSSGRVWSWSAIGQQARYVLLNIWPFLLVKQEQAKAVIELARHVEDYAASRAKPVTPDAIEYRESIRRFVMNLNQKGGNEGRYPSDWHPPPPPLPPRHPLIAVDPWPEEKSLCLTPEIFRFSLVYGFNPLTGRQTPRWRARNVIRWCRPNPPVGALGDKFRPATSDMVVICQDRRRYFDLDAVRTEAIDQRVRTTNGAKNRDGDPTWIQTANYDHRVPSNPAGAPPLDWWKISTQPYSGSHYATWPEELCVIPIKAMCPRKVCTVCGRPSERIVSEPDYLRLDSDRVPARLTKLDGERPAEGVNQHVRADGANTSVVRRVETLGWSDCECPHNPSNDNPTGKWRDGVVLDPFAGSGTTLAVATGHGRQAIGIDLDARNADLALDRVGPLLLTVELPEAVT